MKAESTFGEFIESLAAFIGLLGVVLCLQTSVASVPLHDDQLMMGEKHCCLHRAESAHEHADESARTEQQVTAISATAYGLKLFTGALADGQLSREWQLEAFAQHVRRQSSVFNCPPLLPKRHILFRQLII